MREIAGRNGFGRAFWWTVIVVGIVAITLINGYRATTQSITHDEAVTYQRYVAGPLYKLVSSTDANNHVLNSFLCRLTVGIAGPSELTMRLPSLAGGLLFLIMLTRIGMRAWGPSFTTLVAILVVALNPFVMDYLSIARGYSLALAFWTAGLDCLLAASAMPAESDERQTRVRWMSRCLALSTLANLTFVIAAAGLFGAWTLLERRRHVDIDFRVFARRLFDDAVRPGLIVLAVLAWPLVKLRPSHFYFGAQTFAESLRSIVSASCDHHAETWLFRHQTPTFQNAVDWAAVVFVPIAIAVMAGIWLISFRPMLRRVANLSAGETLFLLAGGTLTFCALAVVFLRLTIGMKLPYERTGIYLVPPFFLTWLGLGVAAPAWARRPALAACTLLAAGVVVLWAEQIEVDHYRTWRPERDLRTIFGQVARRGDPASKQRIRVCSYPGFAPSLNFYRDMFRADFIEPIPRFGGPVVDADVFVVAHASFGGVAPDVPTEEIYRGVAETSVAVPIQRFRLASRR